MTTFFVICGATILLTALLCGYLHHRYAQIGTDMGALRFYWRLLRGRGVRSIGPRQFDRMLAEEHADRVYVDLRAPDRSVTAPLHGIPSHPFDDFLKDVVVHGAYADAKAQELVLICDTGHMSVVAGDVLVEDEGFSRVSSLKGGVEGYRRYRRVAAKACCTLIASLRI